MTVLLLLLLVVGLSASVTAIIAWRDETIAVEERLAAERKAQYWFDKYRALAREVEADHAVEREAEAWKNSFPDSLRVGTSSNPVIAWDGQRALYRTLAEIMKP